MISIKKIISVVLSGTILAASAASLTACHSAHVRNDFVVPDSFDTSRQYEITFWAKNDTNRAQTKIYEQAIESFEELYPNITVNLRLYTDYGKIYNDVITNIATNTTPNVCITYPDHIATYMTGSNVVVPLDDLFSDPQYGLGGSEVRFDGPTFDELVPQFIGECRLDDHYYAIPYMRSTEACYVNKTYVEALGYELPEVLTWDFVWEVSEAAMARNDDGSFVVNDQMTMIPFIYKSTDNMMIQMLTQQGAGYSSPDGTIEIFNDTTRGILSEIATHAQSGAFSTFKISSYPANFLNAGQCIFAIDSTAGATWMGSHAPNIDISADKLIDFETVVYPVPQYDPSNMRMISQGPSVCVFNKDDPQEVLASWLFAQYLLTDEVQMGYAETEGYVPVTLKAQNNPEYLDYLARAGEDDTTHYDIKIAASRMLIENAPNTFVTPVFNGSTSLRDAAGQMIENTVKSVRRGGTVDDQYLDALFEDVKSMYRLDQYGKIDLGPMPETSVILLTCLGVTWVLIGAYVVYGHVKRKNT
ncbi:carbohydrate ABC transporter substrate-binding protein, CUT1 family [Ruminococcaceae bacterium KH2T8]|nr:carbohydrate ABC transporter substrate-binding protein, CUT1 family [Ruminococcaceae bacterium KH2T8]